VAIQSDQARTDAPPMLPLSLADLRHIEEEQNVWLASPPLSDGELAALRQQYPQQAWAYTRETEDGLRRAWRM